MKTLKYQLSSSVILIICILLMFLSWFGGSRGVQEISGTIVLYHPVTIIGILITLIGIWFENRRFAMVCGILGPCLLLIMELSYFFTWHIETITGEFSLGISFSLAACRILFWLWCHTGIAGGKFDAYQEVLLPKMNRNIIL